MKQNVCRKYKYGHCKYGDKCHFRHVKQFCDDKKYKMFALAEKDSDVNTLEKRIEKMENKLDQPNKTVNKKTQELEK